MINDYGNALVGTFNGLWPVVISFSVRLLIAIIVFVVGYIVGVFIGKLIEQAFKAIKVDNALRRAGMEETLRRGGIVLNSGAFVGGLVKWFVIVVFLIASFQIIGLTQVTLFLQQVVISYLPRIIAAVLILLVAVVVGDAMQRIVTASASAARVGSANLLGSITKWIIWVFAILTVLVQLGIGADLIRILFTGVVVAFAIALGLSYGLGGVELAKESLDKVKKQIAKTSFDNNNPPKM
jgi:hypothetical protein